MVIEMKKITDFSNKNLLLVDDDSPFRERLARAMEKKGFNVSQAEGVKKGIESVKQSCPGFAVVDLRLGDGNGLEVVKEIKKGKISFKVDKYGIIHASVGRASFTPEKISENVNELVQTLHKLKPSSSKGIYFKSINLSSTMSPSITIDTKSIKGI